MLSNFGPLKVKRALKMGQFGTTNGSKTGQKRERASQVPNLHFKICNIAKFSKISLFWPKTALQPAENGQMKGNSGYSTHAATLPRPKGPSRAL